MNRKLHNTVTALFATSGLLALSLVASRPLAPDIPMQAPLALPQVAQLEATARHEDAPARPARRGHRGRQSVAMPFFSFFPKG